MPELKRLRKQSNSNGHTMGCIMNSDGFYCPGSQMNWSNLEFEGKHNLLGDQTFYIKDITTVLKFCEEMLGEDLLRPGIPTLRNRKVRSNI